MEGASQASLPYSWKVEIDSSNLSMDGPQPQNSSPDFNLNNDYISNLHADIKAKILEKLSLKEAVRTSILSSTWKDSWTSIPKLVFEENLKEPKLITALVDSVLEVHRGPIKKFKLVSKHACNEAIGRWMLVLSTNGIEHLNLVINGDECKIPSRFFSCNALKFVRLSGCSINVPRSFNGFSLLHTLCLSDFNLSGFGIEKLVSSCPLLEHLELHYFFQQGCLCILAPNLTFLDIIGEFHDICLETPKLASGGIFLSTSDADYRELSLAKDLKESNITRALGHLFNIQKLQICGEFIGYLTMGPTRENLPVFNHLTEIFVDLCICPMDIEVALCVFQNAPNLKILHIKVMEDDFQFSNSEDELHAYVQDLRESKVIKDCLFKHLEVVNMTYIQDHANAIKLSLLSSKLMLEFAKLVLNTAPLLEEFNVIDLGDLSVVLFVDLKFFPRLSKKAKIKFFEGSSTDEE